jgi:hypothetical protein
MNLRGMGVDALLSLRAEIDKKLGEKRSELEQQLSPLGLESDGGQARGRGWGSGRRSAMKGRKVAPKFRVTSPMRFPKVSITSRVNCFERSCRLTTYEFIRPRKRNGSRLTSALTLTVRRQRSLDRPGGLNKGEFLAHRNVHRSEDETANPTIEGTG